MSDVTPAPAAPVAQPTPGATPEPQEAPKPPHHSQRQPRDEAKRFAGPPGEQPAQQEPKPEHPLPPRRIKARYKENGQEIEEEVTEEELIEDRRRLRALRFKETEAKEREKRAAALVKQADEARLVAEALENGDLEPLKAYYAKRGKEPVDGLAELLQKALDERDMDPRERALAEKEAELARREAEIQQRQEQEHAQAFLARVDKNREMLHEVWGKLLEQSDLPKTPDMLEASARIFMTAIQASQGQHVLSHEQVAELTREEMLDATARPLVNAMSHTQFLKNFGGQGSILEKLDESLSPEELLKHMPRAAERFHRYLYQEARKARRGPAPTQKPQQRSSGEAKPENGPKIYDPFSGLGFGS